MLVFEFVLFYYRIYDLFFQFCSLFYYYAKMVKKRKEKPRRYLCTDWNIDDGIEIEKKKWNLSSAIEESLKILNPIRIIFVGERKTEGYPKFI